MVDIDEFVYSLMRRRWYKTSVLIRYKNRQIERARKAILSDWGSFDEKCSNDSRSSAWLLQLCSRDLGTGNNFFLRVLDTMVQGYCLVVTAIYILCYPMYVRGGGQCLMWSGCDL